jgi:diguanylate cyclase (GGDEF)-like protein
VLFCDLDHFKRINDSFGHAVGDVVLAEVAARLEQACRAEDTVARIGGDEFVILVEGIDTDEALPSLVGRVRAAFGEPILAGGVRVNLSVSVGVASTTADDHDGETLLGRADRAMYADKRSRRRQIPA